MNVIADVLISEDSRIMNAHVDKTKENKSQFVANTVSQKPSGGQSLFQVEDNRPEAIQMKKLQEMANGSSRVSQLRVFQEMANNGSRVLQLRHFQEMANNNFIATQVAQLQAIANNNATQQQSAQRMANNTGLPNNLKSGIENISGYSMDDVKVHRNSDKPAQLHAHAYAQGTDIHLGPGQEKHLPHEAWHVVQQKQGRVQPTMQMKATSNSLDTGVNINDDKGLETEADVMGGQALLEGAKSEHSTSVLQKKTLTSSSSPIQYVRKTRVQLLALTVPAFNTHRKAQQMDWANTPGLTQPELKTMWGVLEWGTGGLATFTLQQIINAGPVGTNEGLHLKYYCQAINGKIGNITTIQLEPLLVLNDAIKQGKWLAKLITAIGSGLTLKLTVPLDVFKALIADEAIAEEFLDYYATCHPILQSKKGAEVTAFIAFYAEGGRYATYKDTLPDIRNYHKFEKASLDKLITDKGLKDKPLTLVLVSLFDHNGAFQRHAHVNAVIRNTNTNAFAIEGANIEALANLKDSGLAQIAEDHGMDGKITQLMIAGHGSPKSIELGGKEAASYNMEDGEIERHGKPETARPLIFDASNAEFWTSFFDVAFDNMAAKGTLQPKVLLRACLVGANEIDYDKLKASLSTAEPSLNLDEMGIDPKTPENQTKIRAAIVEQYATHGSLVSVLGGQAHEKGVSVIGAQASISARETKSVNPDTGELGVLPDTIIPLDQQDPHVAGSKINYVRYGKEPTGVLKAVIESWAHDKDDCFLKMEARVGEAAASNDAFSIRLLFETILANHKDDILTANKFVSSAGVLYDIARGGADCRAGKLQNDAMIQANKAAFYTALLGKFANNFAQLVIYEDWMQSDTAKRVNFINQLANVAFNKNNVVDYLNFTMLNTHLTPILTGNIGNIRGQILLGLVGLIDKNKVACKDFLLTQKGVNDILLDVVRDELMGYSEDGLRNQLGLPVANPMPVVLGDLGGGGQQKNIDYTKEYYVEPMRPTKFEKASTNKKVRVREHPVSSGLFTTSRELEVFENDREFTVVGKVKKIEDNSDVGRWMVRRDNYKVGYVSSTSIREVVE